MAALPLRDAARALGVSTVTLRRWLHSGAPCVRRGAHGRGNLYLVDPAAVRRWREPAEPDAALLTFAARLPELLAEAIDTAYMLSPRKNDPAWLACAAWQASLDALLAACGVDAADSVPIPPRIQRLRKLVTK